MQNLQVLPPLQVSQMKENGGRKRIAVNLEAASLGTPSPITLKEFAHRTKLQKMRMKKKRISSSVTYS